MGDLKDLLNIPTTVEPKPNAPFIRATEFDGTQGYIQTEPLPAAPSYDELLEMFGYDPREVKIVGTIRTSKWQQREDGEWLHSYRFAIAPAGTANLDDILKLINSRKIKPTKSEGDKTFHWLAGDLQLGKIDGDGTQGIVDRVLASIENGVNELKTLRKTNAIGNVHIAWLVS